MTKTLLVKNSLVGMIQLVLTAILTFISVPIFIGKLGFELYGVWAVIAVIGNLSLLTNFGLNNALLVYVAKQGKSKESDFDIAVTQIITFIIIGIFSSIIIIYKKIVINAILSIPVEYSHPAENLLVLLVFANAILLFGQIFTSVIDANQKMYISNSCQFIYSLIYWISQILIVSYGGGLTEIGIGALLAAFIWFLIVYVFYRILWGKLKLKGLISNFQKVALKQFSYGIKIYISGLTGFLFEPLSKVLLSKFIGVDAVALFEIGLKIKGQVNGIMVKTLSPLFPFIAQAKDNKNLRDNINDLTLKIQLIVIPLSIIVMFVMKILVEYWLGTENLDQITIFVITMTVTMLLLQPSVLPVYQYLMAKNLAGKTIWIQLSSVIINAVIFFGTYNYFGAYAILLSNTAGLFTAYLLCNYYKYKYLDFLILEKKKYYIKLVGLLLLLLFQSLLIRLYLPFGFWDLIIYPTIIISSFIIYIRYTKLISKSDLEIYFGTYPIVKSKLKWLLIS